MKSSEIKEIFHNRGKSLFSYIFKPGKVLDRQSMVYQFNDRLHSKCFIHLYTRKRFVRLSRRTVISLSLDFFESLSCEGVADLKRKVWETDGTDYGYGGRILCKKR